MEFNAKKCHVLRMGKSEKRPEWTYKMGDEIIQENEHERDLGVIIQGVPYSCPSECGKV